MSNSGDVTSASGGGVVSEDDLCSRHGDERGTIASGAAGSKA